MGNLSSKELDLYSNQILEDYDAKNPSQIFKNKVKVSNEDALLIQNKVTELRVSRGEEIIGYKIGCISKDTQKKMDLSNPAKGTLWKHELHQNGVELNRKDYSNPAMEAEFGVILNRDINPDLVSFDYILESVQSIYPLIEIHNLVFNGNAPNGAELLANNAIHAGVILGPENKVPNSNKITDLKLIYDNEVVDKWIDKKWPFDMLGEIEWLVRDKAKTNNILKKNDLILIGAYGFPVPINEKKLIEVTSSAFGDVSSTFI
ncbi:hypothetical protein OA544_02010 [Candidatus Pelagibacter sp.]|nr:hypothetical protein [Candidatus Pelagibacter sp.]